MKIICPAVSIITAAVLLTGCAHSPSSIGSSGPSMGESAVLLAGAAGGALGGNAINKKYGAPIGAAVGLGAGLLANKAIEASQQEALDASYEQGRRDGRMEVLSKINSNQVATTSNRPSAVNTHYESGVVEGVRMTERDAPSQTLVEPTR